VPSGGIAGCAAIVGDGGAVPAACGLGLIDELISARADRSRVKDDVAEKHYSPQKIDNDYQMKTIRDMNNSRLFLRQGMNDLY
jgi:hypothetical protein